jgi:hypothetical protein
MLGNKKRYEQNVKLFSVNNQFTGILQKTVKILFIITALVLIQTVAKSQTVSEQQCFYAVQGKVAYNQAGDKTWYPGNIRKLCKGTSNPTKTIECFQKQIAKHNDWNRGIEACKAIPPDEPVEPIITQKGNNNKPINKYSYLATHNATASYAYGYSTQNSQRYDVTTQLNAGVRMLNVDIVYDIPDGKNPAGVYICHCGKAPHSYSAMELKRAKDNKNTLSKVPMPFWTSGASYTRFYKILMAIDKWLVENPNEIVFIALENQSATVAQFEAEVERANLKTKTYKKPNSGNWGTRSQLIASNQRLVILSEDSLDLGGKYANYKGLISWQGWLKPKFYGVENTYDPSNVGNYQFSNVGAFRDSPTDAITARYYNDYDELSARKKEWIAKGYSVFPNFISVNQVQVGDALRFVNELNGDDYQVAGTVPKDPAGNWIVNASADIGEFSKDALETTGNAIVQTIKPDTPKARSISFNNQAGYVAKMQIIYFVNQTSGNITVLMPKVLETPYISLGITRHIEVPIDIVKNQPITVMIVGSGTVKKEVYKTTVSTSFTGNICYKSWGTIFDAKGGKCN